MTDRAEPERKQVAIFGAGIAGLTAAHELIERGFDVEVYDIVKPSARDRILGYPCAVGGVARTQWGRIEWDLPESMFSTEPLDLLLDDLETEPDKPPLRILFKENSVEFADPDAAKGSLERIVKKLKSAPNVKRVEVRGYCRSRDAKPLDDKSGWDFKRAQAVADLLKDKVTQTLEPTGLGLGYPLDWRPDDAARDYVSFRVVEHWIPGEHGFRFFPSFYRNLFDTMRRTPVPNDDDLIFRETPRTVLDNLVATEFMGLCTARVTPPFAFHRRPPVSLQEMFDQLTGLLKSTGATLDDVARFQLKLFKYMTSCRARRTEYEALSWWQFLEAEQFSAAFQKYLDSGAESLLAMSTQHCDARTYGSVSVQMIQNQIAGVPRTDATLNGPTTLVWFDHWRRYLVNQGVRFLRGELKEFTLVDDDTMWATVDVYTRVPDEEDKKIPTILMRDYYVVALGADELQRVINRSPGLTGTDFDRIRSFNLGDPHKAVTGGALEHMSGIQFYFRTDLHSIDGHTIFPDSDWRLSALFQPQYWIVKRGWWSGYRGVLSVDISNWHGKKEYAWDKTKQEIAEGVWSQIESQLVIEMQGVRGADSVTRLALPTPMFYHLDGNIRFKERVADGPKLPYVNRTPYLLSRPGEFRERPGIPGAYQVHKGHLVLAGVLMQTYTRLSTMEAANESARHAVNAILTMERGKRDAAHERHGGGRSARLPENDPDQCYVFNIEDFEPADLKLLVDIDEQLHALGLPHFIDILDLREIPKELLRPDPDVAGLGLKRWGVSI